MYLKRRRKQLGQVKSYALFSDRKALSHCCLSYISRACNNIDVFRLLLLSVDEVEEQRNTFRAK